MRVAFLALLLVLAAAPCSLAGDDEIPVVKTSPAAELAAKYLSSDPDVRAEAERALCRLSAAELLEVLAKVREHVLREPSFGPAEPPAPPFTPDATKPLVNLEFWFLRSPPKDTAALVGLLPPEPGPTPAASRIVWMFDSVAAEVLLAAVEKSKGVELVTAPRITTYDAQRANISVLNQLSYIQDYDVEVGMGGSRIADPIVGTVQEGVVVESLPTVSADRKYVTIELNVTSSNVLKPIKEFKTKLATGDKEVTIQIPEVRVLKSRQSLTVPDDGYALLNLDAGGGENDDRRLLVLVHATVLPPASLVPSDFVPPEEVKPAPK
jgi:hypothetical protein